MKLNWVILLAIALLIFLMQICYFWSYTADDAFIIFRYASNFAAGYGLTWNPTATPIEGYTTWLWTLFMTIPVVLHIDIIIFAKIIGILAMLASLAIVYQFIFLILAEVDPKLRRIFAGMGVLMLVGCSGTGVHTISGMETAIATFLTISFLYYLTVYTMHPTKLFAGLVAIIGLLAGWTRPELNLVVLIGLTIAFMLTPKISQRWLLRMTLVFYLIPGIIYFLWRWNYYGYFFPIPFYIKTTTQPYFAGRGMEFGFIKYFGFHLGIFLIFGFLIINKQLLPAVIAVISLILFFIFPSHIMGFNWRYFYPIIPFIFIIAAGGLAKLFSILQSHRRLAIATNSNRFVTRGIFGILFFLVMLGFLSEIPGEISRKQVYATGLMNAHIALGKKLAGYKPETNLPVLAIGDAGAVPYYSRWKTVDTFGLNNPEIAKTGIHDAVKLLADHPDVVVLISQDETRFISKLDWEQSLYDQCIKQGMVLIKVLQFRPQEYYLWVMVYPGTPISQYLKDWN
jgi:arabinofuranosyltransferase